jgi:phosphoribosyl-ATP pyrophosphohydrolase/phosphoribosyl-AMP cyclohydrolase
MLGFMNPESLARTLETGLATFWSRSRRRLWCKGETSGNYLLVKSIRMDCDNDTLLLQAEPKGPTCHRGTTSCFAEDHEFSALEFLAYLDGLIRAQSEDMAASSAALKPPEAGLAAAAARLEQQPSTQAHVAGRDRQRMVEGMADLLHLLLVSLAERQITLREVLDELERRLPARG